MPTDDTKLIRSARRVLKAQGVIGIPATFQHAGINDFGHLTATKVQWIELADAICELDEAIKEIDNAN